MNFYKRFMGDIQAKTGHLSLAEFGAYDRLLDHYYSTEQPLPGDIGRCCSIARAMTKDDRRAVERVLAEFFTLGADGLYRQGRAEEMIAEAQPKIEAARENGKKGGRPTRKTQQKPSGLPEQTHDGTQNTENEKASQNQNHSEHSSEKKARKRASPPKPDDVEVQTWDDWLALRKAKRAPVTQTVVDAARRESEKASLTLEAFLCVWCSRGSQGLEAAWLKPHELQRSAQGLSFRERDTIAKQQKFNEMAGIRSGDIIDMEAPHAPLIASR